MRHIAPCLCGPQRRFVADRVTISDASRRSDPTGTMPLQRRFVGQMDARWRQLKTMASSAVAKRFGGTNAETVAHAVASGDDPLRAFQAWFDESLRQVVLGTSPVSWTNTFVAQAVMQGNARAVALAPIEDKPASRLRTLQTIAVTELQGICEAVSQQAVRAVAAGMLSRKTPAQTARAVSEVIDAVGKTRGRALASFITVRAFGAATLDAFRAAGITHVGLVPERAARKIVADAKSKKFKTGLVEVLTAGDDDVCVACEDISEQGPYTLNEAEDLIPAHPHCRCAFVPADDARFAHDGFDESEERDDIVKDTYDPDEERDAGGKWTSNASGDHEKDYPVAKDNVGGLAVSDNIPNQSSIESSLEDYTALDGVREVQMSAFENSGKPKFYSATEENRTGRLANSIKTNSKIDPLIVVVEENNLKAGPYILEGGHRFDALKILGKKSFPAKVVIDHRAFGKNTSDYDPDQLRGDDGKWTSGGGGDTDVYHGTTKEFGKLRVPSDEDFMLDRMLGVHVAKDPSIAGSFTINRHTGEALPGARVIPLKLDDNKYLQVQQQRYDSGALESDQNAVDKMIMGVAYRKDPSMLARYLKSARAVPEADAPNLARDFIAGKEVATPVDKPQTLDKFINNMSGARPFSVEDRKLAIVLARAEWSGQGYHGLRYTNTAPMEIGQSKGQEKPKDLTSYIVFHPHHLTQKYTGFADGNPDQPRDEHGMWTNGFAGGPPLRTWTPPQSREEWKSVAGQNHSIDEPAVPTLKHYVYTDKDGTTHETKQRMSSGVIMREKDGRTWVIKPTNGYGGYKYTFPKGGVEEGLHPQANAIKEAFEETGLKARITGYAGDYKGDTGITRMYHAVRETGHPKDKGWETEKVRLAHPAELSLLLNRSRDRKIAAHHIPGSGFVVKDGYDPDEPRDDHGKWTAGGGAKGMSNTLTEAGMPHKIIMNDPQHGGADTVSVPYNQVGPSMKSVAESHEGFSHVHEGDTHETYVYNNAHTTSGEEDVPVSQPHAEAPIDMQDLIKVSGKKGSNEGGVYSDMNQSSAHPGYYVKKPATPDHVQNELVAAKLYQLAGVKTLNYVPVKGGQHVATEMETLAKNNVSQLSAGERYMAQKDFAVHAWLANWDAAGTGGDNIGVRANGDVVTLDTGGSLKYRAQGEPKGKAFGNEVTETATLRDPSKNPDAAKLYGSMTNEQIADSIKRVTNISSGDIMKTVVQNGGTVSLANQLIERKQDLAAQAAKMMAPAPASVGSPFSNTTLKLSGNFHVPEDVSPINLGAANAAPAPAETQAQKPTHVFKTKMEHAKYMLLKGVTGKELKDTFSWPSVSMPDTAKKTGLTLSQEKVGGVFKYTGTLNDPNDKSPAALAHAHPNPVIATEWKGAGPKAKPTFGKAAPKVAEPAPVGTTAIDKKISSLVEAKTLASAMKNNGVPNLEFHPAEGKEATGDNQSTHSYSTNSAAEHEKMKSLLTKAGYEFESYDGPTNSGKFYGVKVPHSYTVAPAAPKAPKGTYDLSKPHENFMAGLEANGVPPSAMAHKVLSTGKNVVNVDVKYHAAAAEVAKYHPKADGGAGSYFFPSDDVAANAPKITAAPPPAPVATPAPAPAVSVPKTAPTEAELTKAKKSVALQMQYIPGAKPELVGGDPHTAAEHLIKNFNTKWSSKENLSADQLGEKVHDFKTLTASVNHLATQETAQKEAIAKQSKAVQAEHAKKIKAAQAEKEAKVEAEFEATLNDPKIKAQYEKLHSIGQTSGPHLDKQYAHQIAKVAKLGHTITGADAAYISNWITGSYEKLNSNLWQGDKMDLKQIIFASGLQHALAKMPNYEGMIERGLAHGDVTAKLQRYKDNVGYVVNELGFSAGGAKHKLWGEAVMHIKAKHGRDIRAFNNSEGGGEILLQPNTKLHITKVDMKTKEVWAEEI